MQMRKKSLILGSVILALGLLGSLYWWKGQGGSLKPYEPKKDRAALIQLFRQNWYWLDDRELEGGLKAFEETLNKVGDPAFATRLDVMDWTVYRSKGEARAFISYFMRDSAEKVGKILYLAVDDRFRARGIARQLMTKAIDVLTKKGAKIIEIVTRISNHPAQNLYRSMGFVQVGEDETFVFMELRV